MKAVIFRGHGGPEKLEFTDVEDPRPGPDEVLVRVRSCALNHLDIWVRQGIPAYKIALPHISGCDVSGEVISAPPSSGLTAGARVMISPGLSCFKCAMCLAGHDNLCDSYAILGAGVDGGYAELVKARSSDVLSIPEEVSFDQAAAFALTFLTAWHMLVTRCRILPGEDVLVLAAGSGVGSAAIQIAKLAGARVIAAARSDEKCRRAREIGADEAINYEVEDFSKKVRSMTAGRGVDIVFEHTGSETWTRSILSLAKNGRLVTCGATSGNEVQTDLRYLFSRQLTLMGSMMGTRRELVTLLKLVEEGKIHPVIDSTFPLSEARQAQTRMLERQNFGKIVLKP